MRVLTRLGRRSLRRLVRVVEMTREGLLLLAGESAQPCADRRRQPPLDVVEEVPGGGARGRDHQDPDDDEREPGHNRKNDERHADKAEKHTSRDERRAGDATPMPTGLSKQLARKKSGAMSSLGWCLGAGHAKVSVGRSFCAVGRFRSRTRRRAGRA